MRGYLERIAGAAMAPGGSFHPMTGSVYGRRAEDQSSPEALPWEAGTARDEQIGKASDAEAAGPAVQRVGEAAEPAEEVRLQAAMDGTPAVETWSMFRQTQRRDVSTKEIAEGDSLADAEARATTFFPRAGSASQEGAQTSVERQGAVEAGRVAREAEGVADGGRFGFDTESVTGPVTEPTFVAGPVTGPTLSLLPIASSSKRGLTEGVGARAGRAALPPDGKREDGLASMRQPPLEPRVGEPGATDFSASLGPAQAESTASTRQAGSEPAAYQPLVGRNSSAEGSLQGGAAFLQPRRIGARAADRGEGARASEPARPREPDEIQIHIGRIEVTAVAPAPAVRMQAAPARKTPSLDDYLRRGSGRA